MMQSDDFDIRKPVVLSGRYEALYGWLGANYLAGTLSDQGESIGIVEMGGASTQISFESAVPCENCIGWPDDDSRRIYSKSYLYLGQDQARMSADHLASCFPVNSPLDAIDNSKVGMGSFDECSSALEEKFDVDCETLESGNGPHCVFESTMKVPEDMPFYALSAFVYTFNKMKVSPGDSLSVLRENGSLFCESDWNSLKNSDKTPEKFLMPYCFSSVYFYKLLTQHYGFSPETTRITAVDTINGKPSTWTLGAVLDLLHGNQPEKYKPGI